VQGDVALLAVDGQVGERDLGVAVEVPAIFRRFLEMPGVSPVSAFTATIDEV
jgi:hypothetical protein